MIRLVTPADATVIAREHPLPHKTNASEQLYRSYYLLKTLLYLRAPGAGIAGGWVDGALAGFVFFCRDMTDLKATLLSPRTLLWLFAQIISGRFGYRPSFWLEACRWGLQHLRQPRQYQAASGQSSPAPSDVASWIGTVHTVERFRRRGVASALLAHVEGLLWKCGTSEVALWAATDNEPALQLYEKRGYTRVMVVGRIGEQCWLMVKRLSAPPPAKRSGRRDDPAAIVTDASERVALHVIRALGRKGVLVRAVELAERGPRIAGFSSRYAAHSCTVPGWEQAEEAWLEGTLAAGETGDVLLPSCLNTIVRVLKHEQRLAEKYSFLLPDHASLSVANDKWRLHELCRKIGLEMPRSWRPGVSELEGEADRFTYPAVVKFRHDQDLYAHADQRYQLVADPAELLTCWKGFDAIQNQPIVQEYVQGDGYGFAALYDANSSFVAGFAHRRLVEHPASGGPSAVCESVKVPELEEIGRHILDELSWRGVAMVEFKRCARTGKFYLLEINPRFWGSLPLAEAAGINFPYLLYRAALGEKIPATGYRIGVRMRLLPTYLLSLWSTFRSSPWAVGTWVPKLGYLFDPRVREGIFALDDLKPAFAYLRTRMRGV